MSELPAAGQRLKTERERRGLSSQKAADELHLDGWVIDALEAENFDRIGPSVYVKGHLRRYAALLGLPPEEIMAGYQSHTQAPKAPAPTNVRVHSEGPASAGLPWPQIAGAAAVVLVAAGVAWWKPWHRHAAAGASEATAAAPPTPAPAVVAASGAASGPASADAVSDSELTGAASSPTAIPAAGATGTPGEGDTAGVGRARLRLSFSADSWVEVHDAAGRRVFAGNGRANSMKTIAGIAPLRVYLGFASGVQLEVNGRAVAIGPQFLAGDVARFEAGADGVLRRDTHTTATASAGAAHGARP
jgi:cytoskeleton protein RodZ